MIEGALQGGFERTGSPSKHQQKLAKITDPPFFYNNTTEDKLGFDGWLIQVKNKLTSDSHMYPTEARKVIYVTSLLRSPAYDLISPRLDQSHPQTYATITELYEHMGELWSNPNKQKDARAAFRKLAMDKTDKFQEFYAEFTRLVAEGHISGQDLKDELNSKLWWKLQEAVAVYYNDNSYNLHQFSTMCATNDRQIRERLDRIPRATNKPKPATAVKKDTGNKDSDRQAGRKVAKEDNNPEGKPAITCYNCQKPGHIARKCPEPITSRRKQYLANMVKELKAAEESEGSGNDDL